MTKDKFIRLPEKQLKMFQEINEILYKTSGQKVDDSKLIRIIIYMMIDKFDEKGLDAFPQEFIKNPCGFMKYRDAISRMGKDYNKG